MPSMAELIADHCELDESEIAQLRSLVAEWAVISDLSFSDLVLWVPDRDPNMFWAVAQARPTTGATALVEDVVGDLIAYVPDHLVTEAFFSEQTTETSVNKMLAGMPVRVSVVALPGPQGRVIGVVEKHTWHLTAWRPSTMEEAYTQTADELMGMVGRAEFPVPGLEPRTALSPQVGDGMVRLDAQGDVEYISPNGVSCFRRIGVTADLMEENLADTVAELLDTTGTTHESPANALRGRNPGASELIVGAVHVLVRTIPLWDSSSVRNGALVLCRDVTDLRSRERQLLTKDATIREIHHRVKNNLQTVSALLRMQSRRASSPEARASLLAARSRVTAIAVVHELLSRTHDEQVAFDEIADRLLAMVAEVAAPEAAVTARRIGSFGMIPGGAATNLSLVLTELCQNAVEHGLEVGPGCVLVYVEAARDEMLVEVVDDGAGLPADFASTAAASGSLGLSIVRTLVADLGGHFTISNREDGQGTRAAMLFGATSRVLNPN